MTFQFRNRKASHEKQQALSEYDSKQASTSEILQERKALGSFNELLNDRKDILVIFS